MKKSLEKIIVSIIIFILVFSPGIVFAQTTDTTNAPRAIPVNELSLIPKIAENDLTPEFIDSQIQGSVLATTQSSSSVNSNPANKKALDAAIQGTGGVATCIGSQVISKAITSAVTNATTKLASKATEVLLNVPTAESGNVGANITTQTSAEIGTVGSIFGIGGLALPSWNSMAYCIVNSMLIYIADSTIQWINTGFDGNPAFLTNPDQFFTDLANAEKRAFIQNLAYGVNSNVCGAFKGTIVSSILSRYGRNKQNYYGQQGYENGGYGQQGQNNFNGCPFDQNPGQLNAFLGGNFTEGGGWNTWFQLTQNPNNNPYDTYFRTNENLYSQVAAVKLSKTTELNWNDGILSFRKCEGTEKDKSKCPITTPGKIILGKVQSSLEIGTNRLILVDKFDEVVTALVDQLITVAIDKTLEKVNTN